MARSSQAAVTGEMTAEEQSQLDQMRQDDAVIEHEQPQTQQPAADTTEADPGTGGDQQQADDGRQRMVPHAALHEERERRKQVEKDAAEQRRRDEERLNLVLQRFAQPQAAPQQPTAPTLPDPQQDPAGHILGRMQQSEAVLAQVVQALVQQSQQSQQVQAAGGVMQRAIAMEHEFAAQTPDYAQAVIHLKDQRNKELEAAGWADPGERRQIMDAETQNVAQRALQMGKNPAQVVYELAKVRGFQAPAPQQQAAPETGQRLEQIGRGQQQNRNSLSNTRGSGPAPLNANSLLQMNDEEFEKAMSSKEGRELLGV